MGTLTIRENLLFSANLRLPRDKSEAERGALVMDIISELGLSHVADSKVSVRCTVNSLSISDLYVSLTHWGWDKMATIFQLDNMFKGIFVNENVCKFVKISRKFVPKCPINNIQALDQTMAWCWPGDKPLPEPVIVYWRIDVPLGLNELN